MKVEVFGPGCPRCHEALANVKKAAGAIAGAEVVYIDDLAEIARRGILSTPAVLVGGKILFSGRVPTVEEAELALGAAS
jgi:small redox-active disulfide protein 2